MRIPFRTRDGYADEPIEPGSAVKHRSMRCAAAAKMMPLHKAGKPAPLAGSDDVHQFVGVEDIHHDLVARIGTPLRLRYGISRRMRTGATFAFLK